MPVARTLRLIGIVVGLVAAWQLPALAPHPDDAAPRVRINNPQRRAMIDDAGPRLRIDFAALRAAGLESLVTCASAPWAPVDQALAFIGSTDGVSVVGMTLAGLIVAEGLTVPAELTDRKVNATSRLGARASGMPGMPALGIGAAEPDLVLLGPPDDVEQALVRATSTEPLKGPALLSQPFYTRLNGQELGLLLGHNDETQDAYRQSMREIHVGLIPVGDHFALTAHVVPTSVLSPESLAVLVEKSWPTELAWWTTRPSVRAEDRHVLVEGRLSQSAVAAALKCPM